jgi:integrase
VRGRRNDQSEYDKILALPYTKLIDGKPYALITYRDGNKQRRKARRVNTVAEAISAIEQIRRDLGQRGPAAFEGERMTFVELMDEYQKARTLPKWYADPLLDHFGRQRIQTITYGDIQRFKAARAQVPHHRTGKARSGATVNRELEVLRSILLYAVRHDWLVKNPFSKGPTSLICKSDEESRARVPSPDEEARILAVCVGSREHLRPILIAARDTGLRKGALLSLTWSRVDFRTEGEDLVVGDFLRILKGPRNKKRPPVIALTDRLRDELVKLWEASDKNPASKVFGGIKDIKRSYATACRLAGVTGLHFHDWRHGYATDLMESGVEERLAMRALGHTSADTHAIYTNVDERLARMIASKLDDLHAARRPSGRAAGDVRESNEWVN